MTEEVGERGSERETEEEDRESWLKKITEEEGDKEAEEEEIEIGESTERPSRNERDLVEMDDLLFGSEEEDRRRKEEEGGEVEAEGGMEEEEEEEEELSRDWRGGMGGRGEELVILN